MKELTTTVYGRILCAGIALALFGGGAATIMHSSMSIVVMDITVFVGITFSIVAMALSVEEQKNSLFTTLGLVLLPVALFLYAIGLGLAMKSMPSAGYGFLAIGAVFGALALRGKPSNEAATVAPAH